LAWKTQGTKLNREAQSVLIAAMLSNNGDVFGCERVVTDEGALVGRKSQ
jgi:hypothetical protein